MKTKAAYRPSGMNVASVTPFKEDESLDLERLASHLNELIDAGVDGIVVLGGSGEYVSLSPDERASVIGCAVQAVSKRVPLIVGALGPSTREACEVGEQARNSGADGMLVMPPYYIRASNEGVLHHFKRVAEVSGLPIIVYNNPPRAGWAIEASSCAARGDSRGRRREGLRSRCRPDRGEDERLGEGLSILSGDDDLGYVTLLSGAPGAIWASANLAPRLCAALYRACRDGDVKTAFPLAERLRQLVHIRRIPNHPGPMKEMMAMVGRSVGPARRPLFPMTSAERGRVKTLLDSMGGRVA